MPSTIPLLRKTTVKRRILIPFLACLAAALVASAAGHPVDVTPAQAATCASYSTQAAAQRAQDTRDADGDGVYCESLPCPCAKGNGGGGSRQPAAPSGGTTTGCTRPRGVVPIGFSATKYPHIRAHVQGALRRGWPRILVLNRPGADARRERLLSGRSTRPGMDRDEYPPAIGRGRGAHLARGSNPRGWLADVMLVPSARTGHTVRRWASSCGGSAMGPGSGTSSTRPPLLRRR
jgi:hypothetical protein